MVLSNDKWTIELSEVPDYNPKSADNMPVDGVFELCNDYNKSLLLSVAGDDEKKYIFIVSFYTPHEDYAFLSDDELYLFLNDVVCIFSLKEGKITNKTALDLTGTLFGVYKFQDDFIMYCEMDIIRISRELEVLWDLSARDIFVRYQGDEPAFEMKADRIRLYDFEDNYYEIDYDGKLIKDEEGNN